MAKLPAWLDHFNAKENYSLFYQQPSLAVNMTGSETREARSDENAPQTRSQGQENASPSGGDIAQKIREMDQLACYGVSSNPMREGQFDISRFQELWSTLRDDILITLVQGVQAAVAQPPQCSQSAATPPSSRPSLSSSVPTNRSWSSLFQGAPAEAKPVPKRLDREVMVSRQDCQPLRGEAATPTSIRDKVNKEISETIAGEIVAARVLPSGDVVLTADRPDTAKNLRDKAEWASVLGTKARVKRPRFTVLVKHVMKDAIECVDQEVAHQAIYAENRRLHGVVDFIHVGKSTRDAGRGKKTVSLIIDVATPQQANLLIEEGLILQSVIHEVEVFHRDCVVTRCYKCHGIGHTARVCTRQECCGYCASPGHRDDACGHRMKGGQAKCANCRGPHPAWVKSCRTREKASEIAKQAFLNRPRTFGTPTTQPSRDSLRDVNGGKWQVVEAKKKRRNSDSTSSMPSSTKRGRPRGIDIAGACQRGNMAEYLSHLPSTQ